MCDQVGLSVRDLGQGSVCDQTWGSLCEQDQGSVLGLRLCLSFGSGSGPSLWLVLGLSLGLCVPGNKTDKTHKTPALAEIIFCT